VSVETTKYFNPKRYLCICLSLQESNISPRFGAMTPSDQNDFLHLNFKSKPSSKGEPAVDIFDYPLAKVSPCKGVVTLSLYWKG
jgi:hypothetical protein